MTDCRTCGFPAWRETHAPWCERVRAENRRVREQRLVWDHKLHRYVPEVAA